MEGSCYYSDPYLLRIEDKLYVKNMICALKDFSTAFLKGISLVLKNSTQ